MFPLTILVVVAIALTSCQINPFTATDIAATTKTEVQTKENDVANGGTALSVTAVTAGATAAAKQEIRISFDAVVDAATVGAIKFYTLKAAAAADGAYDRNAAISASGTVQAYGTGCDVVYSLDLTTASNPIEVYIDASALTAAGGTKKLNRDGDKLMGEAIEDDYAGTIAVAGGTAAAGAVRNPQATVTIVGSTSLTVGGTTATLTFSTTKLTESNLKSVIALEKFTGTGWTPVAYTGSFNTATAVYTMTTSTAAANEEVYRAVLNNPYTLKENATTNGVEHRYTNDQSKTFIDLGNDNVGVDTKYNTAVAATATAAFDANNKNGYVDFAYTGGLGVEGVDATTITAANIKIFDTAAQKYIPWESGYLVNKTTIRLVLSPAYTKANHAFQIHTFPGLTDLGATTAATDDKKLGDWQRTTTPLLANIFNGANNL